MRTLLALDQLQRVELLFYFEIQKFDKNTSMIKAEVDVSGVPFNHSSSMQGKNFINQKEFYADLKRKAFYLMEQSKDYMDLVEKGYFMTHVFKFFYRCYDPLNNVVTWSKTVEPFDQYSIHNPRAPFLDDLGNTVVKIHTMTTMMEPKKAKGKMADSVRPQKRGRTPSKTRTKSPLKPWTPSRTRTRTPSRTRTPPRARSTPRASSPPRSRTSSKSRPIQRDRSRSSGRQRDSSRSKSQQDRDREQRTQR